MLKQIKKYSIISISFLFFINFLCCSDDDNDISDKVKTEKVNWYSDIELGNGSWIDNIPFQNNALGGASKCNTIVDFQDYFPKASSCVSAKSICNNIAYLISYLDNSYKGSQKEFSASNTRDPNYLCSVFNEEKPGCSCNNEKIKIKKLIDFISKNSIPTIEETPTNYPDFNSEINCQNTYDYYKNENSPVVNNIQRIVLDESAIIGNICEGNPMIAIINKPIDFYNITHDITKPYKFDNNSELSGENLSILIIGYTPEEKLFPNSKDKAFKILPNWNNEWGDQGYLWIQSQSLLTLINEVEIGPVILSFDISYESIGDSDCKETLSIPIVAKYGQPSDGAVNSGFIFNFNKIKGAFDYEAYLGVSPYGESDFIPAKLDKTNTMIIHQINKIGTYKFKIRALNDNCTSKWLFSNEFKVDEASKAPPSIIAYGLKTLILPSTQNSVAFEITFSKDVTNVKEGISIDNNAILTVNYGWGKGPYSITASWLYPNQNFTITFSDKITDGTKSLRKVTKEIKVAPTPIEEDNIPPKLSWTNFDDASNLQKGTKSFDAKVIFNEDVLNMDNIRVTIDNDAAIDSVNYDNATKIYTLKVSSITDGVNYKMIFSSGITDYYGNPMIEDIRNIRVQGEIKEGCPKYPPENFFVSDGTYEDYVLLKWDEVVDASSYNIYRAINFDGNYQLIANTSETNYTDYPVDGIFYYYKVSAFKDNCQETILSCYNVGYRPFIDCPSDPPNNVIASNGDYSDKIKISWDASPHALYYSIYRAMDASGPWSTLIGESYTTEYNDTSSAEGIYYYYRIMAKKDLCSATDKSSIAFGYKSPTICPSLPPTGINATESVNGHVELEWDEVSTAGFYNVYRSNVEAGPYTKIATCLEENYNDVDIKPGIIYYYKVSSHKLDCTESTLSNFDTGMTKWVAKTIDEEDNVGKYTSLDLDSFENPHISYYDETNRDLKYAYFDGTNWNIQIVKGDSFVGKYSSMVLDSSDHAHISFYDETSSKKDLYYAYFNGSTWDIEEVDTNGTAGYWSTSITLDSNEKPHIVYYVYTPDSDLKYAYKNSGIWYYVTLETTGVVGKYNSAVMDSSDVLHVSYSGSFSNKGLRYLYYDGSVHATGVHSTHNGIGDYNSIALDSLQCPYISYYSGNSQGRNLRFAKKTSSWSKQTVDSDNLMGMYSSITLDSSDNPVISYYDYDNRALKIAYYDGSWNIKLIDRDEELYSGVGEYTSIKIDSSNYIHISYYDSTNKNLKYIKGIR